MRVLALIALLVAHGCTPDTPVAPAVASGPDSGGGEGADTRGDLAAGDAPVDDGERQHDVPQDTVPDVTADVAPDTPVDPCVGKICEDSNPCTQDSCALGQCVHVGVVGQCDDHNACTVGDTCSAGACWPGTVTECSDGIACTVDSCSPSAGCVFLPNASTCDDENACTDDSCLLASGCTHADNQVACSDGNACTLGDTCCSGACTPGANNTCDDGNACTDDSCNPSTGCQHANNEAPCSDGNGCTIGDTCTNGTCLPGAVADCNDGNVCTTDTCKGGCMHAPLSSSPCDDGDPCTTTDSCMNGMCTNGLGLLTTVAGNGKDYDFADGKGKLAGFGGAYGIALAPDGTIYVADSNSERVRAVSPDGNVTTVAGVGTWGAVDGANLSAKFNFPNHIAIAADGGLIVTDLASHTIRRIFGGNVTTLAGKAFYHDLVDDKGAAARFHNPAGLLVRPDGTILVADTWNNRIRAIAADGMVTTFAGTGPTGNIGLLSKDGSLADATLFYPWGLCQATDGAIYVTEATLIRRIQDGQVTTVAGDGIGGYLDGKGVNAKFNQPNGCTVDEVGNIFVADTFNHRIRKIDAGGNVTTVVGIGATNNGGTETPVDGDISVAVLQSPVCLVYNAGVLWIGDTDYLRKFTLPGGACK